MEPQQIITITSVLIGGMGVVLTFLATRGKTRTDAKTALDARIDARVREQLDGAWSKIDALEKAVKDLEDRDKAKSGAFARILRAIERQWPTEHGPDLDPSDIALIEETIPPHWLRRNRGETS